MELIANKRNKSDEITLNLARAIFSGRMKYWPDGTPIRVVMLDKRSAEHKLFCKEVLDIFPRQLQRSWDMIVFSGYGEGPYIAKSLQEMQQVVSKTTGAIGYISEISEKMEVQIVNIK